MYNMYTGDYQKSSQVNKLITCIICIQVTTGSPAGKAWANVDGDMKCIAASTKGHVWAVDKSDRYYENKKF